MQPDPVGIADDLNLYAYTAGDPLNSVDPLGLDGRDVGGCGTRITGEASASCQSGYMDEADEGNKKPRNTDNVQKQNEESAGEAGVYGQQRLGSLHDDVASAGEAVAEGGSEVAETYYTGKFGGKLLASLGLAKFAGSYRLRLIAYSGKNPKGHIAHHGFPQEFRIPLRAKGIDVDDPKWGM